jgi:hypothetical protein
VIVEVGNPKQATVNENRRGLVELEGACTACPRSTDALDAPFAIDRDNLVGSHVGNEYRALGSDTDAMGRVELGKKWLGLHPAFGAQAAYEMGTGVGDEE